MLAKVGPSGLLFYGVSLPAAVMLKLTVTADRRP
jgi:hypothetical protein